MFNAVILGRLEIGYRQLERSNSASLLKKHLTRDLFDSLKTKITPSFGCTLLDVIQSGLDHHDSQVGVYATDAEAYTVFGSLLNPIIEEYHPGFRAVGTQPSKNWGDASVFGNLDPSGKVVLSIKISCARSLSGYPFTPCMNKLQFQMMERKAERTLSRLTGEFKGTFRSLNGMPRHLEQQLYNEDLMFKEHDRFLYSANAYRFWSTGRAIYHNYDNTFLVWCNQEDHLRIFSMQTGGDLGATYRRLIAGVNSIERKISFSRHAKLGFLTLCPTNLGTALRISVQIQVPKLTAERTKLLEVVNRYNLELHGIHGRETNADGIYEICNRRCMGITEFQVVKEVYDGIAQLVKIENEL